jgi:hypothetical protein
VHSRRQAVRWQTHRQAKVRLEGTTDFLPCILSDIGSKGCKIALKKDLPIDRFFKLQLVISDEFILNIEAWVAWHRVINSVDCYGIYFSKIKDSDRSNIHKFIREDLLEQVTDQLWDIEPQEFFKEGGKEMGDVTFSDRRIFERFPVQLPLRFLGIDSSSEGQAQTYDVSAKGIGILAKKALPLRTVLELWLDIPDKGEPLYARGQVVWSKQDSAGEGHRLGINLEKADLMGISRVLRTM